MVAKPNSSLCHRIFQSEFPRSAALGEAQSGPQPIGAVCQIAERLIQMPRGRGISAFRCSTIVPTRGILITCLCKAIQYIMTLFGGLFQNPRYWDIGSRIKNALQFLCFLRGTVAPKGQWPWHSSRYCLAHASPHPAFGWKKRRPGWGFRWSEEVVLFVILELLFAILPTSSCCTCHRFLIHFDLKTGHLVQSGSRITTFTRWIP